MAEDLASAYAVLRPTADACAEAWRVLVTAEREQVERLPNRPRPEDFYGPVADAFRADPRRTDEPHLDRLLELVRPDETWIDVGAGGGRYTLPIALHARRVIAAEPSQGMRQALSASAAEYGIENVEVIDERWPCESKAPVADVCFISQVGYDIAEFAAFSAEMEAHASRLCVAVMFARAPLADFGALWPLVHGIDRVQLPAIGEFATMLHARGRTPSISLLSLPPRIYESRDHLHASSRRPLWVLEGTPEDARLADAVAKLAVEVPGGVTLNPGPRRLGIVTWEPT